eukprot:6415864-Pyramimonas_sp.AAC.1
MRKVKRFRRAFRGGEKQTPFARVFGVGVSPASSFGAEVPGLSFSGWKSHQRLHSCAFSPAHSGVSLSAKLV